MNAFLLLSLLSGMLELGTVLAAFTEGLPMYIVLSLALMYQLGNLLCIPGKRRPKLSVWLSLANLALLGAGLWLEHAGPMAIRPFSPSLWVRGLQVALSSLCIQTLRGEHKAACPTWLKRVFRIAGFLLAPLMVSFPHAGMLLCVLVPLGIALSGRKSPAAGPAPSQDSAPAPKGLSAIMILHQMHYFAYTYVMPLVAIELTHSPYAAAALYGLTWVVYLLPQWFSKRLKYRFDPMIFFFVCHAWLALTMILLSGAFLLGSIPLGLSAWMLTGLGGGSVFCIKDLTPLSRSRNMTLSENLGHFLGTATAVLVATTMSKDSGIPLAATDGLGITLTRLSSILVLLTLIFAMDHCSRYLRKNPLIGNKTKPSKEGEKNG